LTAAVGPRKLAKLLEGHSADDIRDAETLLANAKIDVNNFFASGNGKAEFQELLFNACTPVEFGIQGLPEDGSEEERNRQLEPVLAEIAAYSPLEQSQMAPLSGCERTGHHWP
jgi:DNA primase